MSIPHGVVTVMGDDHAKIKAQVRRLKEAVQRLEAYTALQVNRKAVMAELNFVAQVVYGLRQLAAPRVDAVGGQS